MSPTTTATASLRLLTRSMGSGRWMSSGGGSSLRSSSRSTVQTSPAAVCDYAHLLENENGYGIAKPYHKDGFQQEHYHNKLHGNAAQSSVYQHNAKL